MSERRSNGRSVSLLTAHLVWSAKYRYTILKGDIQVRCRTLLIQICEAEEVETSKGAVSKNHVHMYIDYRPSQRTRDLVKKSKDRSSRKLQQESLELKRKY